MTKRTVLLLALAATTGVPAMAACSTAERQAPLPPQAAGPATGSGSQLSSSGQSNGGSVPLNADGQPMPTSGTVGANVAPGAAAESGGLRTRPGYVPGAAGSPSSVPEGYRIGARAPWGILLDDRPQPEPLPVPAAAPHETGDGRIHRGQQPEPSAPAEPAPDGGGVLILADGASPRIPSVKLPSVQVNDAEVAAVQAPTSDDTSPAPDVRGHALPGTISFPALLSQLPPPPTDHSDEPISDGDKPGKGPRVTDEAADQSTDATTDESGPDSNAPEQQPSATAGLLPFPLVAVLQPTPSPTGTPLTAPQPTASETAPSATGWHIDGLALPNAAPDATGKDGSPAFRKVLRAALAARPDGQRPSPASLRRWSAALQRAAALAPDARTKTQLHTLARYARELAGTSGPERSALQAQRPGATEAASVLRSSLPRRFGVRLLG